MADPDAAKPAILQETRFTVREGLAYRAMRTGAIWMNKLFFGSAILLGLWLVYGSALGAQACVGGVPSVSGAVDHGTTQECSVLLTPTSMYLGGMAVLSFLLSIAFGLLGLLVGKQVLPVAPAATEVGGRDGR
ncbi:MAG TPA: hypothetical protein VHI93_02930 [Candidatus Thermoplasmatota archaeon]|nr:hypothetical protein [Candidatus Thermoplasmatota archaeon]